MMLRSINLVFAICALTAAAPAETVESPGRHDLARPAALQHSRQHLAARHGLRQAFAGDGRLSAARRRACLARQSCHVARDLLSGQLLDVVECRQADSLLRLFQRRLVSRRHRRLGARQSADGGSAARAAPARRGPAVALGRDLAKISCRNKPLEQLSYSCPLTHVAPYPGLDTLKEGIKVLISRHFPPTWTIA